MFSWAKADAKAMEMHSSLIELRTEERSAEVADIVRRCTLKTGVFLQVNPDTILFTQAIQLDPKYGLVVTIS